MKTLKFDVFYKYFQEEITKLSAQLYNDKIINEQFEFVFFDNSGEYFTEMDAIKAEDGVKVDRRVLVNVMNGGGVQDSSIAIETYLQIVSLEVLALDEQREDLEILFTEYIANNKSKVDTFDTATYQLTIDEFPKYSTKFDCHGYEKFTVSFTTNFIVMPGAKLSNNYSLKMIVNGIEGNIKYNSIGMTRTTELSPDLVKRNSSRFFPNTTGFQIKISGLFVEEESAPIIRQLLLDCTQNTSFNSFYKLIFRDNNDIYIPDTVDFSAKDISFNFAFGSIVTWEATFYPGIRLGDSLSINS